MIKRNDGISKDDICQNQFTAYVVLAVKRKRQSYIKKKQRDNEKENRTKMNCTPFVRQYDILSNRWGDLLCQEENRTNDIRRNSREWL